MKFVVVVALALATASTFDLRNAEIKSRNVLVSFIETEGRITNGQDADFGQFPYQASLSLELDAHKISTCGGSLIDKNWVLTAAHCTVNARSATVDLGATIISQPEVSVKVAKSDIIVHANFNKRTLKNDISLVKIPTVTYSANIQRIQLPAISSCYSLYEGEKVIASSWGDIYDGSGTTNHLQWARMEVISNALCSRTYWINIYSTNGCISTTGGIAPCKGDSGSPLVLESSKVQIGLTSFGYKESCEKGYPAAFTRLTSYLEWIKTYTGISY